MVTLYRRYREFLNSIERIQQLRGEFYIDPIIIVVWADPEMNKIGIMENLLKEAKVNYILERRKSQYDGWGKPTTPAELLNFKVGIDFIKSKFQHYFVILQGADILVEEGIYRWISDEIVKYPALLFFWNNKLETQNAWHTNFFAVKDLNYWPKFEDKYANDTLETMWGRRLRDEGLTEFLHSHNSRGLKFKEIHSSVISTNVPNNVGSGVYYFVNGSLQLILIERIKLQIKRAYSWLKSIFRMILLVKR